MTWASFRLATTSLIGDKLRLWFCLFEAVLSVKNEELSDFAFEPVAVAHPSNGTTSCNPKSGLEGSYT